MAAQRESPVPARLIIAAFVFLIVPALNFLQPSAGAQEAPRCWEIVLDVKSDGEYRLEGGDSARRGRFHFSLRWTGWMEKDDEDYLLYRFNCHLSDWQAEETAAAEDVTTVRLTPDFQEKPSLDLKYIFRRGGRLYLNFVVSAIDVPQSAAEDSWALLFPSSEENEQRNGLVAYNACVVKGSNRVALKETEIYAGPVVRTFAWDWKHQQWLPGQQHTRFNSQAHRVQVSLSIIPRSAPGASLLRPGGGIYHTPGGAGRG